MKSVWNIQEIKLSVGMKTSIDSYFRARTSDVIAIPERIFFGAFCDILAY